MTMRSIACALAAVVVLIAPAHGQQGGAKITGTLTYQACADRLCFSPRSLPVSFSVRLRQLDTQRATVPK